MWMPIKETSLNFNTFDIVMNVKVLKRLRRKARRNVKWVDLYSMRVNLRFNRTYLGRLYVIGKIRTFQSFDEALAFFRRRYILAELKLCRLRRKVGAHIGPMG